MKLYTIGFTKKTAEQFFEALKNAHVSTLVDVRLNNRSQLAGFSKGTDLRYFLKEIGGIGYRHELQLAPTQELLTTYREVDRDWASYEAAFVRLITERRIEQLFDATAFDSACLLCSEHTADKCHRRLVSEYLAAKWHDVTIAHL